LLHQRLLLKRLSQLKPLLLQLRQLLKPLSQLKLHQLLPLLLHQHQPLSNNGLVLEKQGFMPCFFFTQFSQISTE
jgi:hypothetical protein